IWEKMWAIIPWHKQKRDRLCGRDVFLPMAYFFLLKKAGGRGKVIVLIIVSRQIFELYPFNYHISHEKGMLSFF
ncbi:MAG: hypothetical protein ACI4TP_00340, partial [Anaerotignum sp.]